MVCEWHTMLRKGEDVNWLNVVISENAFREHGESGSRNISFPSSIEQRTGKR